MKRGEMGRGKTMRRSRSDEDTDIRMTLLKNTTLL
jgi:hypothetical protein